MGALDLRDRPPNLYFASFQSGKVDFAFFWCLDSPNIRWRETPWLNTTSGQGWLDAAPGGSTFSR